MVYETVLAPDMIDIEYEDIIVTQACPSENDPDGASCSLPWESQPAARAQGVA